MKNVKYNSNGVAKRKSKILATVCVFIVVIILITLLVYVFVIFLYFRRLSNEQYGRKVSTKQTRSFC